MTDGYSTLLKQEEKNHAKTADVPHTNTNQKKIAQMKIVDAITTMTNRYIPQMFTMSICVLIALAIQIKQRK